MKIGDIDVTNSILNLEHDVNVLQQILEYIAANNQGVKFPSTQQIIGFQDVALKKMQEKYPNMNVERKK